MGWKEGRSAVVSKKASGAKSESESESDSAVEQRFAKHDRSSTDAPMLGQRTESSPRVLRERRNGRLVLRKPSKSRARAFLHSAHSRPSTAV